MLKSCRPHKNGEAKDLDNVKRDNGERNIFQWPVVNLKKQF